jgi:hypothetical protein
MIEDLVKEMLGERALFYETRVARVRKRAVGAWRSRAPATGARALTCAGVLAAVNIVGDRPAWVIVVVAAAAAAAAALATVLACWRSTATWSSPSSRHAPSCPRRHRPTITQCSASRSATAR